jgi:pimeloyl-ACP methyl ester carboxylesterase
VLGSWTEAYEALNVRMIKVSLPGLGGSSLHPGRRVADWPATDLDPILQAEGVGDFSVSGVSYGTIHAMSVAQHYGMDRVPSMGLRVPYFGLPLSRELDLPNGQPTFPTTEEVRRNTPEVQRWRFALSEMMGLVRDASTPERDCPAELKEIVAATSKAAASSYAALSRDYAEEVKGMSASTIPLEAMLYMMASDVALDLPELDRRNIGLSGDRVVVWYADDDEDCPPSHGRWLAKHFQARTRVFDGYGHAGGAVIDHPRFIEELMGRP